MSLYSCPLDMVVLRHGLHCFPASTRRIKLHLPTIVNLLDNSFLLMSFLSWLSLSHSFTGISCGYHLPQLLIHKSLPQGWLLEESNLRHSFKAQLKLLLLQEVFSIFLRSWLFPHLPIVKGTLLEVHVAHIALLWSVYMLGVGFLLLL